MKPGATLQNIVNTSPETTGKLTKKDVIIVWGGTRDIGRNESVKGLHQIRNFVDKHRQTNIIVMSAPHRYDLEPNSCVNEEVKVYNRKLKKYLKVLNNVHILEVDTDRDFLHKAWITYEPGR